MNKTDFTIRPEAFADRRAAEEVAREAFWNVYRPGCLEHFVLHCWREHPDFVPELAHVLEKDGRIIGQIMYAKAAIRADDGRSIPVLTMGPIGILPAFQGRGYGKALLDFTLEKAAALGAGAVFFEGDIGFYGHSGFVPASSLGIRYHGLPEGADAGFFLGRELAPGYLAGVTGEYATPAPYFVDEAAAERFDAAFPKKEKLVLPGQLF